MFDFITINVGFVYYFHRITQSIQGIKVVEHRTGIAEVTGSNPVEALISLR